MIDFFNTTGTELLNNLFDIVFDILKFLFGWVNIPSFPKDLIDNINTFLDLVFNNLDFLGFFVRPYTLGVVVPYAIFLFSFKYTYKIVMWVIRKLPFINIS